MELQRFKVDCVPAVLSRPRLELLSPCVQHRLAVNHRPGPRADKTRRSSSFVMTCRRFGGVTIGETTEAESIAAVAGTPPAATCIAHAIWPRRQPRTAV